MSRNAPVRGGGKYPPQKHIDPMAQESDSDEEIDDEEEEEVDILEVMQDMGLNQRRKVYALKGLLKKYRDMRRLFKDEMHALELKFLVSDKVMFEARRQVIAGEREVTAEEVAAVQVATTESTIEEIPSDDEKEEKKPRKGVTVVTPADEKAKSALQAAGESATGGIPEFWLTAMKNNEVLEGMITERDEEALKFLTDITTEYIDNDPRKGFTLAFHFAKNDIFSNAILSKKYFMVDDETVIDDDEQTLDKVEGCEIDWASVEKKLTVVIKTKKQRHKSGKGVRVVQREEKCPSFFNFFTAPVEPEDEEEEDEEELPYEDALEMDYEAGLAIRQNLIPRAVHYYSGKAIEEIAAGLNFPYGDDDEEEDDEEEESEEEEEVAAKPIRGGRGGRGGAQPPAKAGGKDCKQQ
jgi:nucleosome assembly protein 1-like 1